MKIYYHILNVCVFGFYKVWKKAKKEKKNYSELKSPHQQEAFIPLCAEPSFKCEMTKFKADPTSING